MEPGLSGPPDPLEVNTGPRDSLEELHAQSQAMPGLLVGAQHERASADEQQRAVSER